MSNISFEEFQKLDIRVGKILEAEPVPKSEKLLKLVVDIGDDPSTNSGQGRRQIIAGIAKEFTPEKILGKSFVVLVNLEPKKLMGLESQGMLLCADVDGKLVCLTPLKEVSPGSKIR